ncbi:hypothetical protein ACFXGA_16375 [Actinosynnema sp. NPDC059335]|uniref:hypothetical protein n=1 Tax=Actinosynnema sp. NPDC059335 TaxID=3346804 RepID=UPI00366F00C1
MLGQRAVAVGAARVYQAGRDLHVHEVVDRRLAEPPPPSRPGDLVPRPLPSTVQRVPRAPMRGRADDLAFLRDTVAAGRHVVLTGPRGAGKTLLLQHAANTGALSGRALGDGVGVVWLDRDPGSAADVLREIAHRCHEVDAGTVLPEGLARDVLGAVRALVVLDGVDLPPEEARLVLSAMPRSVFVLSSRREDLWPLGAQRPLGGLPLDDAVAMVRDELGDRVDPDAVADDWRACDGNPLDVVERAVVRDLAHRLGVLPQGATGPGALAQAVPVVLGSLTGQAGAALRPLVALGDVGWGAGLLAAVCGVPDAEGGGRLARKRLAHREDGRYRVNALVAEHAPAVADAELAAVVERVGEWVAGARPDAVAAELEVVERALRRAMAAGLPETALDLARAASSALAWTRHWGALATVLGLGVRAAVTAGSVRDELSFRYALAVCRLNDGHTRQAAELVAGALSLERDEGDGRLASRLRELDGEVRGLASRRPLSTVDSVLAGARAVRDACAHAVTSVPGGVQLVRLAQEHPALVRGVASITAVAGLVLATLSASGVGDPATAMPPPDVTVTGAPSVTPGGTADPRPTGADPTGADPTGADTAGVSRTGVPTTTAPGGVVGERTSGAVDNGRTGGRTSATTPPPPIPATWGFARVWSVELPIGTTQPLSGPVPDNGQANWTYGPWAMTTPAAGHATATHVAVGRQRVRLPAVGAPGGSVKVTAQDYAAWGGAVGYRPGVSCQPAGWFPDGVDEVVDVVCFDRDGNPDDVPFFLRYVAGSASATRGFVHDDRPTAATFTPDREHGVNAGTVTRTGVGRYTADFPGSAGGVVEVTAVGDAPRHCAVVGRRGQLADLACTTPDGSPADSAFAATFGVGQNLLDDPRKPVGDHVVVTGSGVVTARWASGDAPMTVERLSTGRYRAHFTNGYIPSTMQVTATSAGHHCSVMQFNDYSFPDDATIWVGCFGPSGVVADSGFALVYTSARIH